jgi:phenylacetate-coenzyme A ligase PaaK-like adenylate-forming protein
MLATQDLIREAAHQARLVARLPSWLNQVPLYQQRAAGALPDAARGIPPDLLTRLPCITKADIRRDFPRNLLPPGVELDDLIERELVELEHTSGTTEERTPLLLARGWWAQQEGRALRLNPFIASVLDEMPAARRVTLTSPVCNNDICYTGRPSRADRVVGRALHVNLSRHPFLWSEADLERMASEALGWDPHFLDVDPVYGSVFALYCERRGVRLPSLRFIVSSYEFLSVCHRRCLERVFGVPVFNLYGSTETGHLLIDDGGGVQGNAPNDECGGRLPVPQLAGLANPTAGQGIGGLPDPVLSGVGPRPGGRVSLVPSYETAWLELLEPDEQNIGELVVTTLENDYMPLIRYRIGDLAERLEQPYRTRYVLHGRAADAALTPEGRRVPVSRIDACFAGQDGIAHYQLTETSSGVWTLQFVPDVTEPSAVCLESLSRDLGSLLGLEQSVLVTRTPELLAEPSGKFRLCRPR